MEDTVELVGCEDDLFVLLLLVEDVAADSVVDDGSASFVDAVADVPAADGTVALFVVADEIDVDAVFDVAAGGVADACAAFAYACALRPRVNRSGVTGEFVDTAPGGIELSSFTCGICFHADGPLGVDSTSVDVNSPASFSRNVEVERVIRIGGGNAGVPIGVFVAGDADEGGEVNSAAADVGADVGFNSTWLAADARVAERVADETDRVKRGVTGIGSTIGGDGAGSEEAAVDEDDCVTSSVVLCSVSMFGDVKAAPTLILSNWGFASNDEKDSFISISPSESSFIPMGFSILSDDGLTGGSIIFFSSLVSVLRETGSDLTVGSCFASTLTGFSSDLIDFVFVLVTSCDLSVFFDGSLFVAFAVARVTFVGMGAGGDALVLRFFGGGFELFLVSSSSDSESESLELEDEESESLEEDEDEEEEEEEIARLLRVDFETGFAAVCATVLPLIATSLLALVFVSALFDAPDLVSIGVFVEAAVAGAVGAGVTTTVTGADGGVADDAGEELEACAGTVADGGCSVVSIASDVLTKLCDDCSDLVARGGDGAGCADDIDIGDGDGTMMRGEARGMGS